MLEFFHGSCFGHAISKVFYNVITEEKISWGLTYAYIKGAKINTQKCITWPKKSSKGRQARGQTCIDSRLKPKKLSTHIKIKYVICFCPSYVSNFIQFSTLGFYFLHIVFFVDLVFVPWICMGFLLSRLQAWKLGFVIPTCIDILRHYYSML